tara:strand:- start:9081 stop:9911 length:831 start_codon:yes stop_codon:yes gene_type:complete
MKKVYKNVHLNKIMKKIVSWTQTYGENRLLNIQLLQFDTIGNVLRNKCEFIIFSFHNCSDIFFHNSEYILNKIYDKNKLILVRYNDITYLECFREILKKIEFLNCSDILQIQDDQHGINSITNITNLSDLDIIIEEYQKNKEIQFMHLFSNEALPNDGFLPMEVIEKKNVLFYKYKSTEFRKKGVYSWNDGTYIISIQLIKHLLYQKNIPHNVWHIELFLKAIFDKIPFIRWGTNKIIFKASNLFGKNTNQTISVTENLYRFFGETNDWDKIQLLI